MGLIDFVKDAGAKLFGGKTAAEEKADTAAAEAKAEALAEHHRAIVLKKVVVDLGFEVENLDITVDDDTATVHGTAKDQATRERIVLAMGNTAGIAQVDDRLEVAASEPEATFYTVVRGDTLSKIAKEHYGSANKYMVIFEANKPMLSDPDKIYPGQVLRIPPAEG